MFEGLYGVCTLDGVGQHNQGYVDFWFPADVGLHHFQVRMALGMLVIMVLVARAGCFVGHPGRFSTGNVDTSRTIHAIPGQRAPPLYSQCCPHHAPRSYNSRCLHEQSNGGFHQRLGIFARSYASLELGHWGPRHSREY